MAKSKNKKNLVGNIVLLLVSIVMFLILLEMFVRIFDIAPQYGPLKMYEKDNLLDFKLLPNYRGRFVKQEFEIEIHTNSLGLRDEEYHGKRPNGFNVLALGDSFTWGAYGTELNETFVKILEKRLDEDSNRNYQVINAGVPGYGTDQQLDYLKSYGSQFKPDVVLLNFFVGNDFFDNAQKNEFTAKDNYLVANKAQQNSLEKLRIFLISHFHSYRIMEKGAIIFFDNFIQENVRGKLQYDEREAGLFIKPTIKEIQEQFDMTKQILDEMNSYLKSRNIKLVVVILPLDYQVDENKKQSFIQNNLEGRDFDLGQPQKIILEWARQNDVNVIDLMPELEELEKDGELYWKLNGHFNERGNEEVGRIVYEYLVENNSIK